MYLVPWLIVCLGKVSAYGRLEMLGQLFKQSLDHGYESHGLNRDLA